MTRRAQVGRSDTVREAEQAMPGTRLRGEAAFRSGFARALDVVHDSGQARC